jgi:pimeloyl-ACP methyl ester carboxylesterase
VTQIVANGISLEFDIRGDVFDPAIVLIRGLGTQMIDWPEELLEGLEAEGFRVVIFDNRDVGLSEKFVGLPDLRAVAEGGEIPPYTIQDMADDVAGLMDSLEIEQAHVFAISLGGMIGQLLALNHGEKVLSLVSVMSSSGRPGLPAATPEAAATLVAESDPGIGIEDLIRATAEGLHVCGSPAYPMSEEDRMKIARRRYERNYTPEAAVRQLAAITAIRDMSAMLNEIRVPTLVIHGSDDPLIPVEHGEDTARLIPHAELEIIEGMGHDLPPALMPQMVGIISRFCHHKERLH